MAFAALAPIMTVVGTGVSAYGQYQSYRSEKAMHEYNRDVAKAQEEQIQNETRERVRRQRRSNDRFISQQKAAYAKAGVKTTGTPLEVMARTAADLELAALDTAYAGESAAQAAMQKAAVNQMYADASGRAMPWAVGSTLTKGASQLIRMRT